MSYIFNIMKSEQNNKQSKKLIFIYLEGRIVSGFVNFRVIQEKVYHFLLKKLFLTRSVHLPERTTP